ncbi:hypothetical protein QBC37DRAFT_287659 [Rhypophila decipiens]|uniref:Helicase C-terminal domain-containing protein n=1 Tax=Rhypophila decipiens TaxID=261697 RepID=A0AAN6Y4Q0_9PEZI|nr:hypothetical protein QBC37DRAFT_287659 [Rhypophila decipiens]
MRTKRNLEHHARELAKRYAREDEARQADRERIKGIKFDPNKKDFIPKASRLPRPPRSPTPSTDDNAGQDRSRLSVPGPSRDAATSKSSRARGAPSRDQSQASIRLQLLEDKAQYETEEAQDDDYGAIDQTVIDTFVGAYNTGDSDKAWDTCLSFFNIDPDEWSRAEEMRYKQAAKEGKKRKRVPMKKLPGMTVGLFDYQLMGVLNLLRNVLYNVPGGILADEQGVGKTMEMFGLIALAYNLRRSKTEVEAEWNLGKRSQHNPRQDAEKGGAARTCKLDERYGFRCYCYNGLTQMLADALPDGPNFIIGPERSLEQLYKEGKKKLDTKVLKLRREQDGVDAQERLTAGEIKTLAGNITATGDDTFEYHANTNPKQSEYIIVSHPGQLHKLVQSSFGVKVKTTGDQVVKKSAFLPGMVFMDEFHEFTSAAPQGHETRTVQWLKHLKQNHPPLVYFVSGTPFGDSPADIRAAIDMFDNPNFTIGINHRLEGTRLSDFDELVTTFDNLLARQNGGEALPAEELTDYRRLLNKFLNRMMVRRLGIDKFRGRDITDIGPLSVKITDHPAPPSLVSSLQDLANATCDEVNSHLPEGTSLGNFLRSQAGADLLLKLRLASTFPGISTPLDQEFTFTPSEIASHLSAAKGDLEKTPYYKYIPTWSAYSPKITTILATVNTMIKDKTKIPGEATSAKKLIIFSPLEAESMLIYGYLMYKKQKDKNIKPVWINSVHMDQNDRDTLIAKFKVMGNSPPNILVVSMSLGGTGLNLQNAKYSIVSSPAWSKRENQQAYYRVHRVGQVQDTKLSLLTARWNPADRVLVKKYEGLPVEGSEEEIWGVGDEFAADKEGEGEGKGKGLVDRHQVVTDEEDE